jgi:hypothetical protein
MTSPSEDALAFWKTYWHGLYATPRAWVHKGENLIHAFETVASASVAGSMHLDMRDQALMLAGMAVEVQLKAILVSDPAVRAVVTASKRPVAVPDKSLWVAFYSHDLLSLAREAKVILNNVHRNTAAALSQYIYWRGRYVLPTDRGIDELVPITLSSGLVGQMHQITVEEARDLMSLIVSVVKARLYAKA